MDTCGIRCLPREPGWSGGILWPQGRRAPAGPPKAEAERWRRPRRRAAAPRLI